MPHPLLAAMTEPQPSAVACDRAQLGLDFVCAAAVRADLRHRARLRAKPGSHCLLPEPKRRHPRRRVRASSSDTRSRPIRSSPASCPAVLPEGVYRLRDRPTTRRSRPSPGSSAATASTATATARRRRVRLVVPHGVDADEVARIAEAVVLGRDLDQHARPTTSGPTGSKPRRAISPSATAPRSRASSATSC